LVLTQVSRCDRRLLRVSAQDAGSATGVTARFAGATVALDVRRHHVMIDGRVDADGPDLHERVCRRWPRIYLDTGDLLQIADGRAPEDIVVELSEAMRDRGFLLLISMRHLQDVLPRTGPETVDRFASALERFSLRALVMKGPDELEPWAAQVGDIEIAIASNVREIMTAPAAGPMVDLHADVQEHVHAASVSTTQRRRRGATAALPQAVRDLAFQAFVSIVLGRQGDDPEAVLGFWEVQSGTALTDQERAVVVDSLAPAVDLLRTVSPLLDHHGVDRAQMLRMGWMQRLPGEH
jgi:hypothetical protein